MNNKFSVIIPSFQRPDKAERAVNSVFQQGYEDVEVILVNDGSHPQFDSAYDKFVDDWQRKRKDLIYIKQRRQQRLIARNLGMRAIRNDWIWHLDDDDELMPNSIKAIDDLINGGLVYLLFAGSAQFYAKEGQKLRELKPRVPKMLPDGSYEHFKSGSITMGQFVFHKDCLNKIGYYPHTASYGEFAKLAGIKDYGEKEPDERHKEKWIEVLGNPFGDDYYIYYKLSRHYQVVTTDQVVLKKICRN